MEARRLYPNDLSGPGVLSLHTRLVREIDAALLDPVWGELREHYRSPSFDDPSAGTDGLVFVMTAALLGLAKRLNMNADDFEKLLEASYEKASQVARDARLRVEELLTFDCKLPHATGTDEYLQRSRYAFVLAEYWRLYADLLASHGTSPIGYSPHPLLRYIVSLQHRIERCLEVLAEPWLTEPVKAVLDIPFDVDTVNAWEEWAQPQLAEACTAVERMRIEVGSHQFELTAAEQLFAKSTRIALAEHKKRLSAEWERMLKRVDAAAARWQHAERPLTCFEYLRRVETRLREVVRDTHEKRFGSNWLEQVKAALPSTAVQSAEATMKQRGVTDSDQFLHFTQLQDVYRIVSGRWELFRGSFDGSRTDFNQLMAPILKGRTEEAHHRPPDLWPDEEQQRVRVACYDVLKKLAPPEPRSRQPRSKMAGAP